MSSEWDKAIAECTKLQKQRDELAEALHFILNNCTLYGHGDEARSKALGALSHIDEGYEAGRCEVCGASTQVKVIDVVCEEEFKLTVCRSCKISYK